MPDTARRTFATVNSSAITARQPEVPNLISVFMTELPLVADQAAMVSWIFYRYQPAQCEMRIQARSCARLIHSNGGFHERRPHRTHDHRIAGRSPEDRSRAGGAP